MASVCAILHPVMFQIEDGQNGALRQIKRGTPQLVTAACHVDPPLTPWARS